MDCEECHKNDYPKNLVKSCLIHLFVRLVLSVGLHAELYDTSPVLPTYYLYIFSLVLLAKYKMECIASSLGEIAEEILVG